MKILLNLDPDLAASMMIWLAVSIGLTAIGYLVVWLGHRRK
ncbi:hypothetical protein ACFQH1_02010 [Lactiplantibacillus daoliensis]|uniref:Uncharacterized protein n=1 Tax=Lactiplantibacillus daoliensis TaxID=2559916 RepID=A0ABW1UDS5_9LACO|nr:hypothetical protein [Lactiplantibacillus daoliensis]